MAAPVFVAILERSDDQYQEEGQEGCGPSEDCQLRYLIEAYNDEKVDVRYAMELLEEVLGQEGEHGVFAGAHLVACVLVPLVGLPWVVEENDAPVGVSSPAPEKRAGAEF